jgi:type IV fimbrial biogenesis protein FimT
MCRLQFADATCNGDGPEPLLDQVRQAVQQHRTKGLTLIELLVVITLFAILLAVSVPSIRDLVVKQRLKSINAELVTDLQYARSTAVSRNKPIYVQFSSNSAMSCYVVFVYSFTGNCDCTRTPGSACVSGSEELRTVQVALSTDVQFSPSASSGIAINFSSDGMRLANAGTTIADFQISMTRASGAAGQIRTTLSPTGRPSACTPDGSITGMPAC